MGQHPKRLLFHSQDDGHGSTDAHSGKILQEAGIDAHQLFHLGEVVDSSIYEDMGDDLSFNCRETPGLCPRAKEPQKAFQEVQVSKR